ncbi:MAG: hypothetical protein PUG31_09790 [Eubacteriales bacterium]|jgi:hypothetical protein|nr:hypothetical protein [Clostridiales bacterium]MDD7397690.1 hypothetical protein [Eubacteriales bacterium]MDY2982278.1 hypothetical protein [Eubacteriales bacterium]
MLLMGLMLFLALAYGGLYSVYTCKKSGIAAALSMILLCVCQGVCLGLLLYYRLNP